MTTAPPAAKSCHELASTKRVLAWVNRIRVEIGLKPRKTLALGVMEDGEHCSIANSIQTKRFWTDIDGASISVYNRATDTVVLHRSCPKYVTTWTKRFDEGQYPELVKNSEAL